ncbi:MAG: hypothetical protein NC823_01195, partial [Candidatus Omnitrophica bacterium]|nr:hypothetical protein [Candidatus Omnitrophota bacterium]
MSRPPNKKVKTNLLEIGVIWLLLINLPGNLLSQEKQKVGPPLLLNVPKAEKPPRIDGILEPGEWDKAVSWSVGGWHYVDARKVQFFLLWDEDFVYVGQQAWLLPGETIIRLGRQPKPDVASAMETEMEVFIDAGTNGSNGMPCTYQVIANACGNLWDVEQQWTIGQHNTSWNGQWIFAQRASPDKRAWSAELAIPRKTVYYHQPLSDGLTWKMGFGRDGGRQPNGVFGCVAPVIFKKNTVVVQFSNVEKSVENRMAFNLRLSNPTRQPFKGRLTARISGGNQPEEIREISLAPGAETIIEVDKPAGLNEGQKADFLVELATEKEVIFRWAKVLYNDQFYTVQQWLKPIPPKPFEATLAFNPVHHFLRGKVDIFEFPQKEKVAKAKITVLEKKDNKVLAEGLADNFVYDLAENVIPLPAKLPAGEYPVEIILIDKSGDNLQSLTTSFTKKDEKEFPWLGNNIGFSDRVLWPFQPLQTEGRVIRLWERELVLNDLALPATIISKNRSLLSSHIRLQGA